MRTLSAKTYTYMATPLSKGITLRNAQDRLSLAKVVHGAEHSKKRDESCALNGLLPPGFEGFMPASLGTHLAVTLADGDGVQRSSPVAGLDR